MSNSKFEFGSKKNTIEQVNAQYGKLPPQAIDVEEAVLGALVLEAGAYAKVSTIIEEKSFYKEEHQKIFLAIKNLVDSGTPVDLIQVIRSLKDRNQIDEIGGPVAITELTSKVSSAAHIDHWAKIIQQKFIQREYIRVSQEIQAKAYDDSLDVEDLTSFSNDSLSEIFAPPGSIIKSPSEIMEEIYTKMKENLELTSDVTGFPSGIPSLDSHTGGFQKGDLNIIAAEPGQGKTSFLITIVNKSTDDGHPVGIFSREMPDRQVLAKVITQETDISPRKILNLKMQPKEIAYVDHCREKVEKKKLYIDDRSSSLKAILSMIRYMHQKYGVKLFGIDFIQLIVVPNTGQEERLGQVSRSLKDIAIELDVCIIALSQLRRVSDSKSNHKPSKERLRGSGQIEEAADNIIFIWRPEEYDIDMFDDYNPTEGRALIDVAKGRLIGTTNFIINFKKDAGLFYEGTLIDETQYPDLFTQAGKETFDNNGDTPF